MASELLAHHPVIKTITDYCALFFLQYFLLLDLQYIIKILFFKET